MFLSVGHEKNVIYSKLVNNPFKIRQSNGVLTKKSVNVKFDCMDLPENDMFKGIVHQFWIYNIFFVPHRKKHFLWKVHLDKTTLTQNNSENRVLKVSPFYIYNVYNSTRSDWLWAQYFLDYFESELFYRDEPFIKNVSFVGTRKKCYIIKIGEQSL